MQEMHAERQGGTLILEAGTGLETADMVTRIPVSMSSVRSEADLR